jgi:hypothetical protein
MTMKSWKSHGRCHAVMRADGVGGKELAVRCFPRPISGSSCTFDVGGLGYLVPNIWQKKRGRSSLVIIFRHPLNSHV